MAAKGDYWEIVTEETVPLRATESGWPPRVVGGSFHPLPLAPDRPPAHVAWPGPRRRPHAIKTFEQPVRLVGGPLDLPRAYVYCAREGTDDSFRHLAERCRNNRAWRYHELDTGHNLQYSARKRTLRILRELA